VEISDKPQRDGLDGSRFHRSMIDRIVLIPDVDKYITISRDGTFSVWSAGSGAFIKNMDPLGNVRFSAQLSNGSGGADLAALRARAAAASLTGGATASAAGLSVGNLSANNRDGSWLVDACLLPLANKMAVCSLDRTITFFDNLAFEPQSRLRDKHLMENVPLCMSATAIGEKDVLTIGDNGGNVALINFQPNWHMCDGGS
jgi:hypothetical protein